MDDALPLPATEWPALPPLPEGEWPEQGEWTYDDYRLLPEVPRRRFEVLFGVLWTTRAPMVSHETVVHRLGWELERYQEGAPGDLVLSAPAEVLLPGAAEPARPDLLYVRAERAGIVSGDLVHGAPDVIVEVTARRTGRLDKRVKYAAYEAGGVAEYWIADPRARTLTIYVLEEGAYVLLGEYGAGAAAPSRVLPGLCVPVTRVFGR